MTVLTVLLLLLLALRFTVIAQSEVNVVIDGGEPPVLYSSNPASDSSTWTLVNRSPSNCDTPQHLTERIGDYALFSWTGTSIVVIGMLDQKGGIIGINFDGVNTTFDRTAIHMLCDSILFQKGNLPFQQHTIKLTLQARQVSQVNGQEMGALSIQRFRYTIPSTLSQARSSYEVSPSVVAACVGTASLIAAIIIQCLSPSRRRQVKRPLNFTLYDANDMPPFSRHPSEQEIIDTSPEFAFHQSHGTVTGVWARATFQISAWLISDLG